MTGSAKQSRIFPRWQSGLLRRFAPRNDGKDRAMAVIENTIATSGAAYKANRDGMLALISRIRALEERTRDASAAAKDRFHKRGQLLPRERVALVLDTGSPFIELSKLAGYLFDVADADPRVP